MFVNTLNNDSIERISTALMLIDWKYGLQFGSLLCRHWPAVLQAVHSKQLTLAYKHKAAIYFMSRSEAADLDIVLVMMIYIFVAQHSSEIFFYLVS